MHLTDYRKQSMVVAEQELVSIVLNTYLWGGSSARRDSAYESMPPRAVSAVGARLRRAYRRGCAQSEPASRPSCKRRITQRGYVIRDGTEDLKDRPPIDRLIVMNARSMMLCLRVYLFVRSVFDLELDKASRVLLRHAESPDP